MREIVLDTETTGFDPYSGDRLVEIGCIELINHLPTGKFYHQYLNPERDVPEDVVKIHGLTTEFLKDKPLFKDIVPDFLEFIGTDPLVIHNATFDMKFINAELSWAKFSTIPMDQTIDTLLIAKKKFPGSRVNLNELCRRFEIDNSKRTYHGALLDSELLAEVYLELLGGKEPTLILSEKSKPSVLESRFDNKTTHNIQRKEVRQFPLFEQEQEAHKTFLKKIKDPMWLKLNS